jgi:hypothetical protein
VSGPRKANPAPPTDQELGRELGEALAHEPRTPRGQQYPTDTMPGVQALADRERSTLQRLSHPGVAKRWRAVAEFDQRVAQIDREAAELRRRLSDVHERIGGARSRDSHALARWQLDGQKGPRPEPSLPGLEAERDDLRRELDAYSVATTRLLDQKAAYIERHRPKLLADAECEVKEAAIRYRAAVDAAEQARAELADVRAVELYARLFPAESSLLSVCPPRPRRHRHDPAHLRPRLRRGPPQRRSTVPTGGALWKRHGSAWKQHDAADGNRRPGGFGSAPGKPQHSAVDGSIRADLRSERSQVQILPGA